MSNQFDLPITNFAEWIASGRDRLTVQEALLIVATSGSHAGALDIFAEGHWDESGEFVIAENSPTVRRFRSGPTLDVEQTLLDLSAAFVDFCRATGCVPRDPRNPWARSFVSVQEHGHFEISAAEFAEFAAAYGLAAPDPREEGPPRQKPGPKPSEWKLRLRDGYASISSEAAGASITPDRAVAWLAKTYPNKFSKGQRENELLRILDADGQKAEIISRRTVANALSEFRKAFGAKKTH